MSGGISDNIVITSYSIHYTKLYDDMMEVARHLVDNAKSLGIDLQQPLKIELRDGGQRLFRRRIARIAECFNQAFGS